jgi:tRNA modification GTPase
MESADPARDTIAAIATPAGRGGVGIIRISGPDSPLVARTLAGKLPAPRRATVVTLRDASGGRIDEGLALYFPAPHSYTGEPVVELHGHGSPVVLGLVLGACVEAGVRLAEPGEFTRRAFLNGKLDLAQAESVADLIEAATAQAARSALRSLSGEFSAAVRSLVDQLTELRALTEATLDFPEEEIDAVHRKDVRAGLAKVREALEQVFARSRSGSLLRSGVNVVLAGRPNVGKSSLLNRLAGEERAIVTPVPGTTRDTVRETIAIEGIPFNLADTAGLHETVDEVERMGIERTWLEVGRADVVLVMLDAQAGLTEADQAIVRQLPQDARRIYVLNKIDLGGLPARVRQGPPEEVLVSAKTGEGIDLLRAALLRAAGWEHSAESPFIARDRHLRALESAGDHLAGAERHQAQWEFFAEELRLAQAALSSITGEFTPDDLLGEIFSRFCIGK